MFMIMVGFLLFEPEALEGMDRSWRRRALFFAYFFFVSKIKNRYDTTYIA